MLTFLIVLMPLSIVFYEFIKKEPKDFMPILIGLLSSTLFCAIKAFVSFSHRVVPFDFGTNFAFYFIHQTLLPIAVIYIFFFVISKDDLDFKVNSFFPLISSFYAIYLPFTVISANQSTVYPFYEILFKPFIFLCMILSLSVTSKFILKEFKNKNIPLMVLDIFAVLIFMLIPSVIETMYAVNILLALRIILGIAYCILPFFYLVYLFLRKIGD